MSIRYTMFNTEYAQYFVKTGKETQRVTDFKQIYKWSTSSITNKNILSI